MTNVVVDIAGSEGVWWTVKADAELMIEYVHGIEQYDESYVISIGVITWK